MNISNKTLFFLLFTQLLIVSCNSSNKITINIPEIDHFRSKIIFSAPFENKTYNGSWIDNDEYFKKQYNEILNANPELDAKFSISNNNFYFIGLSGYTYIIPKIKSKKEISLLEKYGYIVICGTSDTINDNLPPLQMVSYDYALRYNEYILKELLRN